jgi:hypothetical protein
MSSSDFKALTKPEISRKNIDSVVERMVRLYAGDSRMPYFHNISVLQADEFLRSHMILLLEYLLDINQDVTREQLCLHSSTSAIVQYVCNRMSSDDTVQRMQSYISDAVIEQVVEIEFRHLFGV